MRVRPVSVLGTLICLAPAAMELPLLLRVALDAQQVGATRIHLPDDLVDPGRVITELRSRTELIISAAGDNPLAGVVDLITEPTDQPLVTSNPLFTATALVTVTAERQPGAHAVLTELHVVLTGEPATLVADLAATIAAAPGPISVVGRDEAALPALLTALAAGAHLRIGTADTAASQGSREDVALVARAVGLARLAGRPPLRLDQARRQLGLG